MNSLRTCVAVFVCGAGLFLTSTGTSAAREDEAVRIAQEARQSLAAGETTGTQQEGELVFDYGTWLNYRYISYHDDDNDSSVDDSTEQLHWIDSRVWFKATLKPLTDSGYQKEHYLFLRVKDLMTQSLPESTAGGWDHDGPHLEYAYMSLDARPFWVRIGRKYFSVGQGIAMGDDNDGAEVFFQSADWFLKAFLAQTVPGEDNVDTSVPGYDKDSDRYFYGFEYGYLGFPGHDLYCYVVGQEDSSDARPDDPDYDYRYDSQYYGLGAEGPLAKAFTYRLEAIKEYGRSRVYDTAEKREIDAWAAVSRVAYTPRVYAHPNVSFEYAFGSGDSSRTSVTDTYGGNTSQKDGNFLYFGYFPTSYALFPRLSNIHICRAGIALRPLESNAVFKHLTIGADYYRFFKDKSGGGVYDPEASDNDRDIGSEIDLTLGWRIFSDLGVYARYGHFMPGGAYSPDANNNEDYFSVSTSITF